MSPLRIGVLAAVAVAGPPLWLAVDQGDLTSWGAVGRGVVVALACTLGAAYVRGLLHDYDVEARRAEEKYLAKALAERLKAERDRLERERDAGKADQAKKTAKVAKAVSPPST